MRQSTHEFIHASRGLASLPQLARLFSEKVAGFGLHSWAYQVLGAPAGPDSFLYTGTYPEEWVERYAEQGYARIDPLVRQGTARTDLFQWSGLAHPKALTPQQQAFMDEARGMGLNDGLGLAIHGHGGVQALLTFATDARSEDLCQTMTEAADDLFILGLAFHNFAHGHLKDTADTAQNPLTARERECLTWLAVGKTFWETAQILNISESGVKFHATRARQKLGVYSTRKAIVLAIQRGFIAL